MMDIKPGTPASASVLVGNKTFSGNLIILLDVVLSPVVTSVNYKGWQPGNFVKSIIEGKLEEIFLRLVIFYFGVGGGRDSPLSPLSLSQCLSLQFVLCISTFYMILLTTHYSLLWLLCLHILHDTTDYAIIFVHNFCANFCFANKSHWGL